MDKTQTMRRIEKEYGTEFPALFFDLFDRLKTTEAVAAELDISYPTLVDWLDHFGLERVREVRHITRLRYRPEAVATR